MRRAMGVAVFSGMLGVTFFGLILTPVFYVIARLVKKAVTGRQTMISVATVAEPSVL